MSALLPTPAARALAAAPLTRAELRALPLAAFIGMDAVTGRAIAGEAHLARSIRDILTTPRGSEVMARGYGAGVFEQTDAPLTAERGAAVVAAAAEALGEHEPRVDVRRVLTRTGAGRLDVSLDLARPGAAPDAGAVFNLSDVLGVA